MLSRELFDAQRLPGERHRALDTAERRAAPAERQPAFRERELAAGLERAERAFGGHAAADDSLDGKFQAGELRGFAEAEVVGGEVEFADGLVVEQPGEGGVRPGVPKIEREERVAFQPQLRPVREPDALQRDGFVHHADAGGEGRFVIRQRERGEGQAAARVAALEVGIDRVEQRGGRAERTHFAQPREKLAAVAFRGALAIPVDERAAGERLGEVRLLQERGVFREVLDGGMHLAPVLFVADDVHDAAPAHVVAGVEERDVGDLVFVAVELHARVQFLDGRAAPAQVRAGDDELAVEFLILAADGAVNVHAAGGEFELGQQQRGEFGQVVDLRRDVARKLRAPPGDAGHGQRHFAGEIEPAVALREREFRHLDAPVEQLRAEHERVPLAALPLEIRGLEPELRAGFGKLLRRPVEAEVAGLDGPAGRIGNAEKERQLGDVDLGKRAGDVNGKMRLVGERLHIGAEPAAKGRKLHRELQPAPREVVERGGEILHLHAGFERESRDLQRAVLDRGGAGDVAKIAREPRLLDKDLPGGDRAGLHVAERERGLEQAHVVAVAFKNEIDIRRLEPLRQDQPVTARTRQAPGESGRRRGAGRGQRQAQFAGHALDREALEPRPGAAREQVAPGKARGRGLDLEPGDGAVFTLAGPDRIPQDDGLEEAAADAADLHVHAIAPGLAADELPHGEAKAVRLEERKHRDDEQQQREAEGPEAARARAGGPGRGCGLRGGAGRGGSQDRAGSVTRRAEKESRLDFIPGFARHRP